MIFSLPLPLAEAITNTRWGFARLQDMNQRWHWLLLLLVCVAVLAYVAYTYYRDSVELPRGVGFSLLLLRAFAFLAILFSFLDLEKKTERVLVKNSRVVLAVDTSQSMGLKDTAAGNSADAADAPSRVGEVVAEFGKELANGSLINDLRQKHDVTVVSFDQGSKPQSIESFGRFQDSDTVTATPQIDLAKHETTLWELRSLLGAAGVMAAAGFALAMCYFIFSGSRYTAALAWLLLAGVLLMLGGLVTAAVASLSRSEIPLLAALGMQNPADYPPDPVEEQQPSSADEGDDVDAQADETSPGDEEKPEKQPDEVDWQTVLAPQGIETRLGDTLADIVQRERGGPLAGIAVFTDGRKNAGIDCAEAILLAKDAGIPIYPVGMGSDKQPANVRVVDIEAPPRVFPGDKFPITVYVQGYGLPDRLVKVSLSSAPADSAADAEPVFEFEEEINIRLGTGDSVEPIKFEVTPADDEQGGRFYRATVDQLVEESDARDNQKQVTVEVVQRKNRVLLLSDGPTREYRFLRNMLFRDPDVTLDVCLQTAAPGISQEADEILPEFPVTEQELFERYDCIVAIDPDWLKLDLDQVRLLDRWVAEKAGGLILIGGPLNTPEWVRRERGDERIDTVKGLYPVVFDRWSLAGARLPENDTAWPIVFTREGEIAEFLWLDDTALGSEQNWASTDGVFGFFKIISLKGAKPGATVYARFGDPQMVVDDEQPVYLAAQFYGAGRVFFLASGEMWRMRSVDEEYFETFYTKLIRHVSQGRLLRDSSRGVLMVSKPRCRLGDTIIVRTHLSDRQYEPLDMPEVEATLAMPRGERLPLMLKPVKDAPRPGLYAGQFTALEEGDYRVELIIPDSDGELLSREVRVRMENLEIKQPQRDDMLLREIAKQTGGEYYVGLPAAMGRRGAPPLATVIEPNDLPTTLPEIPDTDFDRLLMGWLLGAICGALSLEWLIRRLSKLA